VSIDAVSEWETSRHIPLEGCFNFRDIGGYTSTDGREVRWRRLFRAGGPHALTAADVEALRPLGVITIIDLRTRDEAEERGAYTPHVDARAVHTLPMTDVLPPPDEMVGWVDPAYVADRYFEMLRDGSNAIATTLTLLADAGTYPAMMHCSAGKDRTGILVAIVLGLLGVSDEQIVADYALSGPAMHAMLAYYERTIPEGRERMAQYAPAILAAEPDAMVRLIARIRSEFGSFDGYAAALGVEDAVPPIRAALLQ
jgi:protein-tyrosine phosphatase